LEDVTGRNVRKPRPAWRMTLVSAFVVLVALTVFFAHRVQEVRRQSKDLECRSNLFQTGTALLNLADHYGCFPPPHITDQNGKPLYSWRVFILPEYSGPHDVYDQFDFTKSWDDPANKRFCEGESNSTLSRLFSCPILPRTSKFEADYFYALNAKDEWPRDFFNDGPRHMLLVESRVRTTYWTEPVDFEYQEPGFKGLLNKLRESKPIHNAGCNCFLSDGSRTLKIPAAADPDFDSDNFGDLARMPRTSDARTKLQTWRLINNLIKILGEQDRPHSFYMRHRALLYLAELGPQAKAAVAMIRRILAEEQDQRLTRVAAFALAKIGK